MSDIDRRHASDAGLSDSLGCNLDSGLSHVLEVVVQTEVNALNIDLGRVHLIELFQL